MQSLRHAVTVLYSELAWSKPLIELPSKYLKIDEPRWTHLSLVPPRFPGSGIPSINTTQGSNETVLRTCTRLPPVFSVKAHTTPPQDHHGVLVPKVIFGRFHGVVLILIVVSVAYAAASPTTRAVTSPSRAIPNRPTIVCEPSTVRTGSGSCTSDVDHPQAEGASSRPPDSFYPYIPTPPTPPSYRTSPTHRLTSVNANADNTSHPTPSSPLSTSSTTGQSSDDGRMRMMRRRRRTDGDYVSVDSTNTSESSPTPASSITTTITSRYYAENAHLDSQPSSTPPPSPSPTPSNSNPNWKTIVAIIVGVGVFVGIIPSWVIGSVIWREGV
ncbi:hypothetical protein BDY19DRAFT_908510 [Irpex rosettiformis]|uniref:Uncharacterized protein n=1 Tax=Irpex rosettiformis TaxID=378272 RepID=A0ACB8TWA4_9APHY|nr:hypothetical protein BDY19DRAFT_908510 [Irpex rosettiformis]